MSLKAVVFDYGMVLSNAPHTEHQQEILRTQWRQQGAGASGRRVLSVWWLLHVPLSLALWVLAAAHVAGTLYYATLSR